MDLWNFCVDGLRGTLKKQGKMQKGSGEGPRSLEAASLGRYLEQQCSHQLFALVFLLYLRDGVRVCD
jgi:hypothetical protein